MNLTAPLQQQRDSKFKFIVDIDKMIMISD